jgi:BolA protein
MTSLERQQTIRQRLERHFTPTYLEIIDDSHQHVGHAGSRDGAGHYTVIMASTCFVNKSRVAVHQEIYAVLNDLIPHEIHALQIKIRREASE